MKNKCIVTYFLILLLIVFFMLLYALILPMQPIIIEQSNKPFELFTTDEKITLLPKDKILVIQGNGVPDENTPFIEFDQTDPSMASVDGTKDGPASLFAFAYNKCDPECCGDSGGYSCDHGCLCITDKQKKYFGSRGWNNKFNKCFYDEMEN